MADLNDQQAAQTVKITGSNPSGTETNFINATATGDLQTVDILSSGGLQSTITVGTTAVELKVGASNLANRKSLTLDNTSNVVLYWSYSSSITTTNYAGRIFKDQQASWAVSAAVSIYVIAASAGNTVRISEAG